MIEPKNKIKQSFRGKVVSVVGGKTAVVAVTRYIKHPKYQKYYRKTKKYQAASADGACKVGDFVTIETHRPLSKSKKWIIKEKIS
ncbi:MAG: 30S ribosomal protein S17 [Patescibacteria group bacterium]